MKILAAIGVAVMVSACSGESADFPDGEILGPTGASGGTIHSGCWEPEPEPVCSEYCEMGDYHCVPCEKPEPECSEYCEMGDYHCIPCDDGCTLTQGYWSTHYDGSTTAEDVDWPAPEDEDNAFFCSGISWIEMIQAAPGNPPAGAVPPDEQYYNLGRQYIGAMLNAAAGANTSDIASSLSTAENMLMDCNGWNSAQLANADTLTSALDAYNNGRTGPGHCD